MNKLPKSILALILYGAGEKQITVNAKTEKFSGSFNTRFEGVIPQLERRYKETDSDYVRSEIEKYMRAKVCDVCEGRKLNSVALSVTVAEKNISEVVVFPVNELMYEVITKLRSEKIETFDYFFCLTRPDLSNVFSECDIPINFSEVDLCPKGNVLVVDSNTYFTSSEKEMLENSFPERYFIAEKYIKDWKKCRESAVFLQTLSNVSIIDGKIMNISIYKID